MRKQPKGDLRRQKKRTHKSLRTGDLHTPFSYTVSAEAEVDMRKAVSLIHWYA